MAVQVTHLGSSGNSNEVHVWANEDYVCTTGWTDSDLLRLYSFDGSFTLIDSVVSGGVPFGAKIGGVTYIFARKNDQLVAYSASGSGLTLIDSISCPSLYSSWFSDPYLFVHSTSGLMRVFHFNGSSLYQANFFSTGISSNGGVWGNSSRLCVAGTGGCYVYNRVGGSLSRLRLVPGNSWDVWCKDNLVYWIPSDILTVVDIGSGDTLASYPSLTGMSSIWGDDDFIYSTTRDAGLEGGVFSFDSLASSITLEAFIPGGAAWGVFGDGTYIYTTGDSVKAFLVEDSGTQSSSSSLSSESSSSESSSSNSSSTLLMSTSSQTDSSSSSSSSVSSASSSSQSSSSQSSSSQSSSVIDWTFWDENRTYASECTDIESISSPLVGKEAGMTLRGWMEENSENWQVLNESDHIHTRRGGLDKTQAGQGVVWCQDASKLFSMRSGAVRLRLNLPYGINSGVYEPLAGCTTHIQDYVIWAVNMGDYYITSPGLYAALTPHGIEFTIWSNAGKHTIIDTTTNYVSGNDVILEFAWNSKANSRPGENTMYISVNGTYTVVDNPRISSDSLHDLYELSDSTFKHAELWVLDSPSRKHGLKCTIKRLETFSFTPLSKAVGEESSFSSSSSSSSSEHSLDLYMANSTFGFDFIASPGNKVEINPVEFATVTKKRVSLNSNGMGGAFRDTLGIDSGAPNETIGLPETPYDLPPGFEEVFNAS